MHMMRILLGAEQRAVRGEVLRRLCARAAEGAEQLTLLVPEPYSHDMERALCEAGGDTISLHAEVLSFTRLAARAASVYGGAARPALDRGGRLVAMSAAIEAVQSRLKLFGTGLKRPDFLLRLLAVTDECKTSRVGTEELRRAAERATGRLALKLEELALIRESYETVCAAMGQDPGDRLDRLDETLQETDYAAGRSYWLLGFSDFTGQELRILEDLLRGGAEMTVGLVAGDGKSPAFAVAGDTRRRLLRLAASCGVRAEEEPVADPDGPEELRRLREGLFGGGGPSGEPAPALTLHRSRGVYGACLDAADKIQSLVRRGLRYRDVTVCCTSPEAEFPVLTDIFERFSIPVYVAGARSAADEPVALCVLTALDAATGGMEAENVFGFLKSGLSPVTAEECDALENYALTWNIRGARWENDWDMHPDGYGAALDGAAAARLQALNAARRRGAAPLLRLRDGLRAAKKTEGQVRAVYAFLEEIGLGRRLEEMAENSRDEGELQRAQEYGQLYDRVISAMEQLVRVLGRTVREEADFSRLFAALLTQYQVATIPANLDSVNVCGLEAARYADTAAVLLVGADDGAFPAYQSDTSLLTEQDRRELLRLGVELPAGQDAQMERQLAVIHGALSAAREYMTIYACTEQPSYLFTRAAALFPCNPIETDQAVPELLFSSPEALGILLAGDSPGLRALRAASPEAAALADELRGRAAYGAGKLSRETVAGLYGGKLCLSASRIDRYASCRCAYFLKDGLKLQPRKAAAFDAPVYGTFVHAVLERTARCVQEEGGFRTVSEERLMALAAEAAREAQDEMLRRMRARSERFSYLFDRNLTEVMEVVRDLWRELRVSDFEPAAFEVGFTPEGPLPVVRVHGKTGEAEISGYVDRVDLFDCGGTRYVRVVDYKTGKKSFDYADVENGVGLQMLIYLFALEQNGETLFGKPLQPAGVLYFPARRPLLTAPGKMLPDEAEAKRAAELTRRGLISDSEVVLGAMEHFEKAPRYMPYRLSAKNGPTGDLMDAGELRLLRAHVERTLSAMTDAICAGEVSPNPIVRGPDQSACAWCDYAQVCHRASGAAEERPIASVSRTEFWESLEREAEKHG